MFRVASNLFGGTVSGVFGVPGSPVVPWWEKLMVQVWTKIKRTLDIIQWPLENYHVVKQ